MDRTKFHLAEASWAYRLTLKRSWFHDAGPLLTDQWDSLATSC